MTDSNRKRAARMLRHPETLADYLEGVVETIDTYGELDSGRTIIMNELRQLAVALRPRGGNSMNEPEARPICGETAINDHTNRQVKCIKPRDHFLHDGTGWHVDAEGYHFGPMR